MSSVRPGDFVTIVPLANESPYGHSWKTGVGLVVSVTVERTFGLGDQQLVRVLWSKPNMIGPMMSPHVLKCIGDAPTR